ncbi:MAG TPA: adenylate/guanylate cyclase domain-containing protein [Saprospiraceae bacterium]|nr:adenylate/guanylate cyclase domain-containing protein [Saprospiraceae bacterium]
MSHPSPIRLSLISLLLLLLPCGAGLHAQSVADSLLRLLNAAPPDTHRVSLLVNLAWEINESDTEQAARHLQEALALARRLGDRRVEANALSGLGLVEEIRGNYREALRYHQAALLYRQALNDERGMAGAYINLGNAYESLGQLDSAINSHRQSLTLFERLGDTVRMARAHSNIGGVLQEGGDYAGAFGELNKARLLVAAKGDSATIAKMYTKLGHNRFDMDMFQQAKTWYEKSLHIRRQAGDPADLAEGLADLGNVLDELENKDSTRLAIRYYEQALDIYQALEDQPNLALIYNNLADAYKHLDLLDKALAYLRQAESIQTELADEAGLMLTYNTQNDVLARQGKNQESLDYIRRYEAIAQRIGNRKYELGALKDYARAYEQMGDFASAYRYQVRYSDLRFKILDEKRAQNIETQQALATANEREIALEKQKQAATLRDLRNQRTRNALVGGVVAFLLLALLLYNRARIRARANRDLAAKNALIEQERQRADALLRNILPEETAAELKRNNAVKPVRYESVTVLFSDFKGFTTIAEHISPEELVAELDTFFRLFDSIVERHGLEKIKTIGDAYMCAGGLPTPNLSHPVDTVRAAVEMQRSLHELMEQKRLAGKPVFEMRIGIHTGPVVAGVVGSHKFAYDIWGDTVNTAARMEQGGEAGRINISETTYLAVRHEFRCTHRGRLAAKNKGEVDMYFVEQESLS